VSDLLKLAKLKGYLGKLHFNLDNFDEEMARNHQRSIADFCKEWGFSDKFVERFVQPIMAITFSRPEHISAAFGLRILAVGVYENKVPVSGIDVVAKTLHKQLGDRVIMRAEVIEVRPNGNRFNLRYRREGEVQALDVEILVLAVPLFVCNSLIPQLNLKYDYSNAIRLIFKGRVKPKYSNPTVIMVTRSKNPSNISNFGPGKMTGGITFADLYSKPFDLSRFFESYEVLREVHQYPGIGVPRPGASFPSLETEIENVYICGDFYRYPSTEAALVSGNRVADMIYVKNPQRGFLRF